MDFLDIVMHGFLYLWMFIIGSIPNLFMGGLTFCILAALYTYVERRRSEDT